MSDYVFPQFNDYDDPQNFAFHLGQSNLGDFVEYGLSLTADHAAETFDLSEGKAYVEQTDAVGDASGETRHRLVYGVHVDAIADIGFATTNGVNYVWLDPNLGSQDSPDIVVETNNAAPSDASLKLSEIDAANDTAAVETNRAPEADFRTPFAIEDADGVTRLDVPENGPMTVASGGDLHLSPGSILTFEDDDGDGKGWQMSERPDNGAWRLLSTDATDYLRMYQGGPFELRNADFRLRTGHSIVDTSDVVRLGVDSGTGTSLRDGGGNLIFSGSDGNNTRAHAYSGQPLTVRDNEGAFDALTYTTSSYAPGRLALTNSDLELRGGQVRVLDTTRDTDNDTASPLDVSASVSSDASIILAYLAVKNESSTGDVYLQAGGLTSGNEYSYVNVVTGTETTGKNKMKIGQTPGGTRAAQWQIELRNSFFSTSRNSIHAVCGGENVLSDSMYVGTIDDGGAFTSLQLTSQNDATGEIYLIGYELKTP